MAHENLDAQVAAVKRAVKGCPYSYRSALYEAIRTLERLAKLRGQCLEGPDLSEEEFTERISSEIMEVLRLPTGE